MRIEDFVQAIKMVVLDQAVSDMIENLEEPPGRIPPHELIELSSFYKGLSHQNQEIIKKILIQTAEITLFGMFCVLDGVRAIENTENKGSLELWYRNGEETFLLNDPEEEFLHDLI
ncbi:hypothetical protein [Haliscomenobacter sp.]|uniref:hypothetical protein n=1 Tax=Haliscomenobacter sp. TaxID=2717303 RepID=UPI003593C91B